MLLAALLRLNLSRLDAFYAQENPEITRSQLEVMTALRSSPAPLSGRELCERTGFDRSTMGGVLMALRKVQFIERVPTHDSRQRANVVTKPGIAALRAARAKMRKAERRVLQALGTAWVAKSDRLRGQLSSIVTEEG